MSRQTEAALVASRMRNRFKRFKFGFVSQAARAAAYQEELSRIWIRLKNCV